MKDVWHQRWFHFAIGFPIALVVWWFLICVVKDFVVQLMTKG